MIANLDTWIRMMRTACEDALRDADLPWSLPLAVWYAKAARRALDRGDRQEAMAALVEAVKLSIEYVEAPGVRKALSRVPALARQDPA